VFAEKMGTLEDLLFGGLQPWNFMTFQKQLGISSSQLTNSMIFQRGGVGQPPTRQFLPVNPLG
jgi:hypothetical protein